MNRPTDPKNPTTVSESLARVLPVDTNIGRLNELAIAYKERINRATPLKNRGVGTLLKQKDKLDVDAIQNFNNVDKVNQSSNRMSIYDTSEEFNKLSNLKKMNKNKNSKLLFDLQISESIKKNSNLKRLTNILEKYKNLSSSTDNSKPSTSNSFLSHQNHIDLEKEIYDSSYIKDLTQPPSSLGSILNSEADYGEKIKEIRKLQKISQERLAMLAGISVLSIKNIERGVGNPSLKTILKINDVLNIKLALV